MKFKFLLLFILVCSAVMITTIILDKESYLVDVENQSLSTDGDNNISKGIIPIKVNKKITIPYKITRKKNKAKVVKLDKESLKKITPRIAALWNVKKGRGSYYRKVNVINKMGKNLSIQERHSLYEYVRSGPSENAYDLAAIDYVLIKLENRKDIAEEFVNEMSNIVDDKNIDGSIRGYVMQHLGIAYDDKPEFRKSLKETYYTGLKDKSTDVAGTSLMILTNLSKRFNEFDKDLIKTAAIELAADEDTQHASRISVISKLGELQAKESLPSIRKQIKEGKGIVIKLAAIHSLGMLGEEKDIEVLEGFLADSSEVIYNKAASKALAILKNRI